MNDVNSLTHTRWNCKYHIVFAPKYRRKVFYGEKRREIGAILRTLCNWKKIRIIEAEVCPDHVHMLVEIPPKVAISSFMGYLKGKSSLMIYEKYPELRYKYRNREFWALLTKALSAPPYQQKKTPTGVIRRVLSSVSGSMRSPTRGSGPPLPLSLVAKRALSCARASARKTSPRTRPAAASVPLDKQARGCASNCAAGPPQSS